jgi:hypothetical protein
MYCVCTRRMLHPNINLPPDIRNLMSRGVYLTYRRVLDWTIGFITLMHSTRNYKKLQRYRYSPHTLVSSVYYTPH